MSIRYQFTAYCDSCGYDIAEDDSDDWPELGELISQRAERLYAQHVMENRCEAA